MLWVICRSIHFQKNQLAGKGCVNALWSLLFRNTHSKNIARCILPSSTLETNVMTSVTMAGSMMIYGIRKSS